MEYCSVFKKMKFFVSRILGVEYCSVFKKMKLRQQDSGSGILFGTQENEVSSAGFWEWNIVRKIKKMKFHQQDSGSGILFGIQENEVFRQQDSGSGILFGIQENEVLSAVFWEWNIVRYSRK